MITFDEPPDQHALYWPDNDYRFGRLAIRDDQAAATHQAMFNTPPDAHWWAPNQNEEPITWDSLLNEVLAADPMCHPTDAIVLAPIDTHRTAPE